MKMKGNSQSSPSRALAKISQLFFNPGAVILKYILFVLVFFLHKTLTCFVWICTKHKIKTCTEKLGR